MEETDLGGMCECSTEGEPVTTFEHRDLKPRKEHKCVECGNTIKKNQLCEYTRYKWVGRFYKDYTCLPCVGISDDFCCSQRGNLVEVFEETYGWDYRKLPV